MPILSNEKEKATLAESAKVAFLLFTAFPYPFVSLRLTTAETVLRKEGLLLFYLFHSS